MAGEKKTTIKFDTGSIDAFSNKFKEGIEKSLGSLNTSKLKEKFDDTFSMKGIETNLKKSFQEGLAGSTKMKAKQEGMTKALVKNAQLSKSFSNAVASGAGKSEVLSKGLALAANSSLGMLKNINPYVAALKVGVTLAKEFLKTYQQTLETSSKFISQGSLFTDRKTMDMMQRTGQSASGAQGTNRSLDRLGMSFEDLQTGKVTKEQMAMFEKLRKSETERLESIAAIGGPVFESMQHAAVAVATAKQKFEDAVTFAFAKSKGVLQFAQSLQGFATTLGDTIWGMKDTISPIVGFVAEILSVILDSLAPINDIIKVVIEQVSRVFTTLQPAVKAMGGALKSTFAAVGASLSIIIKIVGKFMEIAAAKISVYVQIGGAIIEAIMSVLMPILDIAMVFVDLVSSLLPVTEAMAALQPILDIITTSLKIVGAAIGWIIGKIGDGLRWMWTTTVDFITKIVNAIPKFIHGMINDIIDLINEIPGVNVKSLDDYTGVDIAGLLGNLQGGLDSTLASIQGDTFNYNTTTEITTPDVANENLFTNMYTIVND